MLYSYRVADTAGRRTRHVEPAESPAALARALESRGYLVLDIAPARERAAGATFSFASRQHVLEFTRALAALLPAGLPLARALGAAENLTSGALRETVAVVRGRVERGDSVATALTEHPRFFSPIYVGLVRAGERSGDLAGSFARLASQLERESQLRARLLSAMLYPTLLALVGGAAVVVLLLFVLHPAPAEPRGGRDRLALHRPERSRYARRQRDDRGAADAPAVRAAVSGERGA